MPDFVLRHSATLATVWTTHGLSVAGYLDANPGSTAGEIGVGLGLNSGDVYYILKLLRSAGALYEGQDVNGNTYLWTTWTMGNLVITNLAAVRAWVAVNDNVTVAQIAAQFSIHQAVAYKIAALLQIERDIHLDLVV